MAVPVSGEAKDFWALTEESRYTEEMGMNLEAVNGMGILW